METNQQDTKRLHPIVWVAAVAVTLFSLVGIGAITGVIPTAGSQQKAPESAPLAAAQPAAAKPDIAPEPAPKAVKRVEEPAAKPAAKPVQQKPVEHKPAPRPQAVAAAPGEYPVLMAQAPAAAPAKQVCRDCATIAGVREVKQEGDGTGLGAVGGAVLGGVLGNQVGGGSGKKIMTVVGAAAGGYAGHQTEKHMRSTSKWEVTVRYEDGNTQVIPFDQAPTWREGDRVRVTEGRIVAR